MARPLGSGARGLPRCPDPAHAGGRVTLNGRYGAHHPRQRYRCYPPQGAAHTFTGTAHSSEFGHPIRQLSATPRGGRRSWSDRRFRE